MKVKMKTRLVDMPEENMVELLDVVRLIRKNAKPDMIILFGKYAGGTMRSVLGGYELLLVTFRKPEVDPFKLHQILDREYHRYLRTEPDIFLHSYSLDHINSCGPRSYFFYMIRNEGVVLYDTGRCELFSRPAFQMTRAYEHATGLFDHYFGTGTTALAKAQQAWEAEQPRFAALNLSLAADALFRTVEAVFYGNIIRAGLPFCYIRTRHFSQRLAAQFDTAFYENRDMLKDFAFYANGANDDPHFMLPRKKYNRYLMKINALQEIVETACREHIALIGEKMRREPPELPDESPEIVPVEHPEPVSPQTEILLPETVATGDLSTDANALA